MSDPIELAQSWLDRHALSCARGHAHQHNVCEISQALLDRERQLHDLQEAAKEAWDYLSHSEPDAAAVVLETALAAPDRET